MSSELDPILAARLARDAYFVQNDFGRQLLKRDYQHIMAITEDSFADGTRGALIFLKKSQLGGIFARGVGVYRGQVFLAFRGTEDLYDGLTDLNTGVKISHTGCAVHQGFYYAFDSVLSELRTFLSSCAGVHTIHCVGHSLGGALATLAADWLKNSGVSGVVKLYTFGSPRVGLDMFARKCTSRLVDSNIYRVYHRTDPIPMVPTWPFYHVPMTATDYGIWSPMSIPPWKYHRMKHYIESVERAGSWVAIEKARPESLTDSSVESWLKSDGVVLSLTANTLEFLNAALLYVFKRSVNVVGIFIVGGFATTFTLLDRMAMILARAAELSVDAGNWVERLVRKMAALVGVVVGVGVALTVAFIRMIFLRLHQRISHLVWQAGRDQ